MQEAKVVVVGGYGMVGSQVCRMLAADPGVRVVVAGRSLEKARMLAEKIGAEARQVDVHDAASVVAALADATVVINCFIDLANPGLHVAETAAARGLTYLDVAAIPPSYNQAVLALSDRAAASGATLITALGANPGIPALVALSNQSALDTVDEVDLYFTLGSRLDGISVLSLRGVGDMLRQPPRAWSNGEWRAPTETTRTRVLQEPYNRKVYFGAAMMTEDLRDVPRMLGAKRLAFWSALEETLQSTAFLAGFKLGQATTDQKAERFLKFLKWTASSSATTACLLEIHATGIQGGKRVRREVSLHAAEETLTAVAPVVVCRQVLAGEVARRGAFVGPAVVPAPSFVEHLRKAPVNLREVTVAA